MPTDSISKSEMPTYSKVFVSKILGCSLLLGSAMGWAQTSSDTSPLNLVGTFYEKDCNQRPFMQSQTYSQAAVMIQPGPANSYVMSVAIGYFFDPECKDLLSVSSSMYESTQQPVSIRKSTEAFQFDLIGTKFIPSEQLLKRLSAGQPMGSLQFNQLLRKVLADSKSVNVNFEFQYLPGSKDPNTSNEDQLIISSIDLFPISLKAPVNPNAVDFPAPAIKHILRLVRSPVVKPQSEQQALEVNWPQ